MDTERQKLEECLTVARTAGQTRLAIQAMVLLADLDQTEGQMGKAIDHLLNALSDSLDSSDKQAMEFCFGKLGLIYLEDGQYEKASECFRNALENGPDSPNKIAWMGSLGQVLAELGQFDEALTCYDQVLEQAKQTGDVLSQAICLGSLGNVHYEQERYDKANRCYRLALAQIDNEPRPRSMWLGNIASTEAKLGNFKQALECANEALAIAKELNDTTLQAAHLDTLGDTCIQKGDLDSAISYYDQALALSRSLGPSPYERVYLGNLARANFKVGNNDAAFKLFSQAIDQFDQQRSNLRADHLKTSFSTRGQDLYKDMIQLCLLEGKRVEALEYVSRSKSRAMLDLLGNSPVDISELSGVDDQSLARLIYKEQEVREKIKHLERVWGEKSGNDDKSTSRGAAESLLPDMNFLYSEWRQVIEQLKMRHPQYANLVSVDALTFSDMRALWKDCLPGNTAIVEYFLTDNYLLALAIFDNVSEPVIILTDSQDELTQLRADLSNFLHMVATEGWQVPLSLSKRLYKRLLEPLLKQIPPAIDSLIIVPHESLYHLPFAALHDGDGYVIEKWNISHLPSTSLIPILKTRHANSTSDSKELKYLVSAVSDYSDTRKSQHIVKSGMRSSSGFDDLTHTKKEAESVVAITKPEKTTVITDSQVGELLPELFNQHEVVHFAGHAIFRTNEPLASGLVMSDGRVLTAASILNAGTLRTKKGKLMVLSACQTGLNRITSGGEIIGLTRALMYAGMPNLILSLWEVADESTANLMHDFYAGWQKGTMSISKALRQAQIAAIKKKLAPHAWAPFIHIGTQ